jgi:hypothetical protein
MEPTRHYYECVESNGKTLIRRPKSADALLGNRKTSHSANWRVGKSSHDETSTPERIRTSNLRFRRPMLYPIELRVQEGRHGTSRKAEIITADQPLERPLQLNFSPRLGLVPSESAHLKNARGGPARPRRAPLQAPEAVRVKSLRGRGGDPERAAMRLGKAAPSSCKSRCFIVSPDGAE